MKSKHLIRGISASLMLMIVYMLILTYLQSFAHAVQQFADFWYLMAPLVILFGAQVGLYSGIRDSIKNRGEATGCVAASGSVSAGSMVLCCLHHTADVLPLLGLSAAALFVSRYQTAFLILGISSSIAGIFFMLNIMQKTGIKKFRFNMKIIRNVMFVVGVFAVLLSFIIL